jgi:benzoate-CoA ligase family protein
MRGSHGIVPRSKSACIMDLSYQQLPIAFNAADHFAARNIRAGRSTKVAFSYGDWKVTYADLLDGVHRAATLIRQSGVQREQRVALALPDSPELVFLFWGAIWAGCVPVPLNVASRIEDLCYAIEDSRARLLATNASLRAAMVLSDGPRVIVIDGPAALQDVLAATPPMTTHAATHRDEPAFWLYTSGTTGKPKAVIHAHHHMVTCAEKYGRSVISLSEKDICYSVAKIPFAYGLGNSLYMPMAVGGAAVLSSATNAFDVVADVARFRPTVFFGLPSIYAELLALQEIAPLDTSSIRLCISAAEQLPIPIWQGFRDRYQLEICEGIGTTEMLHIFLANRPGACKAGTSGRPVPGYDVQVVAADGSEAKPGEVGSLLVSGSTLMLGYWNRDPETRRAIHGYGMRTGDRYVVDEEGYFTFIGRDDDLVKVHGMWVTPIEIESVLLQHSAVADCGVVLDRTSDESMPKLEAYVVLRSGVERQNAAMDIRTFAKSRLQSFKVPRQVHVVATLPRTPTGKLDRKRLAAVTNVRL